ncbi:MAG TPA: nucleotidyl transferase AbiEii/AbiGii toxin family protein [Pyrinomonadaceae bacterium]|jgi:hypothetical protein|nr:nucleotidyl transferase AbiEii/AbiGii toxin family protein [Pyrinomonadaceae bacterium]
MKLVFEAAQEIQDFFEQNEWHFCFIGGIALQRWAIPRLTNDADLTLLTGFGSEENFVKKILERFESRVDDPIDFALRSRVVLLKVKNVGIDISLGALFFEESAVRRATIWEFSRTISLNTCSAEDLIVFKAFADRLQDWADIQSILSVQNNLEWDYIYEQLTPLVELKEAPEIMDKLINLRSQS